MRRKKGRGMLLLIGLLLLLAGLALWYGFCIEPNQLVVRRYPLSAPMAEGETLRVVQISDLQIGEDYTVKHLERVVDKIEKLQPDVILFNGDLFEHYSVCGATIEAEVTALLQQLEAAGGKYAVWGNRDYGGGAARAYQRIMAAAGFELLCNSSVEIPLAGGGRMLLCGLDDSLFGTPNGQSFPEQQPDYVYRILMLHEPDMAQLWSHSVFQLILAGHSHGGQVRLPFWRGETTVLAQQYTRHFYTLNGETGLQLYVNTGLGTSHLPVRFGVPPEIVLFELGAEG